MTRRGRRIDGHDTACGGGSIAAALWEQLQPRIIYLGLLPDPARVGTLAAAVLGLRALVVALALRLLLRWLHTPSTG